MNKNLISLGLLRNGKVYGTKQLAIQGLTQVAVFKDAVKDVTAQFAAEYGPEACAAFDITVA